MWQWVKACKGAALVAFFLPWMTVSCSSTELLRASGWDLATGRPRLSPQLIELAGGQVGRSGAHPSVWLLLALAAIVAGLIVAFLPARRGAAPALAAAIAAIVLLVVGTFRLGREAFASASVHGGLGGAVAAQIRIAWLPSYWLCLGALAGAAVLAGVSLRRRVGASP